MPNNQGNLNASRNFLRSRQSSSSATLLGGKVVQQSVNTLTGVINGTLHRDFLSLIKSIDKLITQFHKPTIAGNISRQGMLLGLTSNGLAAPGATFANASGGIAYGLGLLKQKGNGGHSATQQHAAGTPAAAGGGSGNNNGGIAGGTTGGSSGQYGGKGNGGLPPVSSQVANMVYGKTSSKGLTAATWGVYAGKALAKYGEEKQIDQMMMELGAVGASYGTNPGSFGYSSFNYNTFGTGGKPRSEGAFSVQDALQAELARARASGGIALSTPRDKSFDTSWRALATANPWMGAENSAQAIAELTQPRNQQLAIGLGLGELFDKDHAFIGMGKFTDNFLKWTYGNKADQIDPETFFAGTAQGGSVANNMNQLNMSDQSRAGMIMFMEQFLTARSRGLKDATQFEQLMKSATTADDPLHDQARDTLRNKYGVETKTNLQEEKNISAVERGFDSTHLKEFNDNLRAANEQIYRGKREWKEFLDQQPFRAFYQFSAWWAKFLKDPWGMLLGGINAAGNDPVLKTPNAPHLGIGGGEVGAMSGLFGGWNVGGQSDRHAPGGAGPNVKPASDKTAKGDGSGGDAKKGKAQDSPRGSIGAVISAALSQKGVKYSWGGGNKKGPSYGIEHGSNIFGFDCSGLMEYAYWQGAGIDIGGTTWEQMRSPKGHDVGWNNVQPGDLVFSTSGGHVVMWMGDGYVHAPRTGDVVKTVKGKPYSIGRVRRYLGGGKDGAGVNLGDDAYDNSNKQKGDIGTASVAGGMQQLGSPSGSSGSSGAGAAAAPGSIRSDELEILFGLMGTDLAVPINKTTLISPAGEEDPPPSAFIGDNSVSDPVQPGGAFNQAGAGASWLQPQHTQGVLKNDTGVGTNKGKDKNKDTAKADTGGAFKRDKGHPRTWNYAPDNAGPVDRAGNKSIAQSMLKSFGWGSKTEWDALDKLWTKESGWNQYADNAWSDAYGIPQSLPGTKMKSAGADWRTNPATQIKWGLGYIKGRYGDPLRAWAHSQATGWYDTGSWEIPHDQMAVVHKGEMIIPAKKAQTIREEIIRETTSSPSPGNGWQIVFGPGSVTIQLGPGATEDMASRAADKFFERLEKKVKYAQIAQGA